MPPTAKGRAFGRYEVVRQLGRGAVGEVYLARDPVLGRAVAIKILSGLDGLPDAEQVEARARFLREARAAAALSHPHIVTIHDVGEADGVPFLAMEYLRGTTLDRYAKPGHLLPAAKVLEIGIEAASALEEAHRHGIVHRDVKPANLVLLEDGALKVADFGLAKGPELGLTARETLLGTPNYMSPEQIAAEPLDGRSDLFSLAVSIYELLAGQRPFGGDTVSSVLYRIVNDPPRPLHEVRPDLPAELGTLLERALAKQRDQRPASAGAFANELSAILAGLGGVPAGLRLPPPAETSGAVKATTAVGGPRAGGGGTTKRTAAIVVVLVIALVAALGLTRSLWMPSARRVTIDVRPAGLALDVSGGAASVDGNVVSIPREQVQPVTVEIADKCQEGRVTLDPARLADRVPLNATPRGVPLKVTSAPDGAVVQLNGEPQGTTPATVRAVACRANEVRLTAGGATKTIALAADDSPDAWQRSVTAVALGAPAPQAVAAKEPEAKPEPKTGKVTISAPPGYTADVRLASGKELGAAGKTYTLPAGSNELLFVNPAVHLRHQVTLDVRGGTSSTPTIEWPALGGLSVYAVPAGGRVLLRPRGGAGAPVELGVTPLNQLPIVAGNYELTIEHPTSEGKAVHREVTVGGSTAVVRVAREDWEQ